MVDCVVLKEGRGVVGEACDQVSTDFVVEKFWYKNLTLRGRMNLDRKFCLPGDVLELITCAQKTSIFWRLFGQMEIYEKERHAWSAPEKKNTVVKVVELVTKCWNAISGRVRRHALRHFWKSTKNWKEAMTWRQVDKSTTGQVEKNTNRQTDKVD